MEEGEKIEIPILQIVPEVEAKQRRRLAEVRASRNAAAVEQAVKDLKQAARDGGNLLPHFLSCTRVYVTLGEMCSTLTEVFGLHQEAAIF